MLVLLWISDSLAMAVHPKDPGKPTWSPSKCLADTGAAQAGQRGSSRHSILEAVLQEAAKRNHWDQEVLPSILKLYYKHFSAAWLEILQSPHNLAWTLKTNPLGLRKWSSSLTEDISPISIQTTFYHRMELFGFSIQNAAANFKQILKKFSSFSRNVHV